MGTRSVVFAVLVVLAVVAIAAVAVAVTRRRAGMTAGGNACALASMFSQSVDDLRGRVLRKFAGGSRPTAATWLAMRAAVTADGRAAALLYMATRKQSGGTAGPHMGGTAIAFPPGASSDGTFTKACSDFILNLLLPIRPVMYWASGNIGTGLYCSGDSNQDCSSSYWGLSLATGKYVALAGAPTCMSKEVASTIAVTSTDTEYDVWAQAQAGAKDSTVMWAMMCRLLMLLLLGGEMPPLTATMDPNAALGLVPSTTEAAEKSELARNWTWDRGQPLMITLDSGSTLEGYGYMWLSADEVLNILTGDDTITPMYDVWKSSYASQVQVAGYRSRLSPTEIAISGLDA